MTKIINLGASAFYELQEATKKAKISFDGFENAISKAFPKQAKKEKSIKDKSNTGRQHIILVFRLSLTIKAEKLRLILLVINRSFFYFSYPRNEISTPAATAEPITPDILLDMQYCST